MKSFIFLFITILLHNIAEAQINDLLDIKNYIYFTEGRYVAGDSIRHDWTRENREPHITYVKENEKIIRTEYCLHGNLKSKCEITYGTRRDTSVVSDYETQEPRISISETMFDMPNGSFVEYFCGLRGNVVKSKGICKNANRIGKWLFYDNNGHKTVVTYNDNGDLDGPYQEYYYSRKDKTYSKKIEGQFGMRTITKTYIDKNGKTKIYDIDENRRTGIWKYYNRNGELLEEAKYSWYKK